MGPRRDWSGARLKCDAEGGCRVCGRSRTEAAHIIGRKHDEPKSIGSKTLWVKPDRIVPLCGGPYKPGCHALYDEHKLDLLGHLTKEEQAQAVLDSGSIESARRRLWPSAYKEAGAAA